MIRSLSLLALLACLVELRASFVGAGELDPSKSTHLGGPIGHKQGSDRSPHDQSEEARLAYVDLFVSSRKLSNNEVLKSLDKYERWIGHPEANLKKPDINTGLLRIFAQLPNKQYCIWHFMAKMSGFAWVAKSRHYRALRGLLSDGFDRQMTLCVKLARKEAEAFRGSPHWDIIESFFRGAGKRVKWNEYHIKDST